MSESGQAEWSESSGKGSGVVVERFNRAAFCLGNLHDVSCPIEQMQHRIEAVISGSP